MRGWASPRTKPTSTLNAAAPSSPSNQTAGRGSLRRGVLPATLAETFSSAAAACCRAARRCAGKIGAFRAVRLLRRRLVAAEVLPMPGL